MTRQNKNLMNLAGIPVFESSVIRGNSNIVKEESLIQIQNACINHNGSIEKPVVSPIVSNEDIVGLVVSCTCGSETKILFDSVATNHQALEQPASEENSAQ
ncbi:MAG: hypothetical protein ACRBF0_15540 [Calditrichia bacterium]